MAGAGDGGFLAALPPDAIDTILALVGPGVDTSLQSVEIRHLGGALGREARGAGAQPKVDAEYLFVGGGLAPTPELRSSASRDARVLKEALAPWHAGYDYYNFVETAAEAEVALPAASYRRLREVKATYDPDQTIIPPTQSARPETDMSTITTIEQGPMLASAWQALAEGAIDDDPGLASRSVRTDRCDFGALGGVLLRPPPASRGAVAARTHPGMARSGRRCRPPGAPGWRINTRPSRTSSLRRGTSSVTELTCRSSSSETPTTGARARRC